MKKLFSFCIILVLLSFPAFTLPTVGLTAADSSPIVDSVGTGGLYTILQILNTELSIAHSFNINATPKYDKVNPSDKSISLSSAPTIDLGSTLYREFVLDITENINVNERLLSLDEPRFIGSISSTLTSFSISDNKLSSFTLPLIYSFGVEEWIQLGVSLLEVK